MRRDFRASRRGSGSELGVAEEDNGHGSDGLFSVVSRPERILISFSFQIHFIISSKGNVSTLPPSSRSSQQAITWTRREEIADPIGHFFAWCVAGEHRGHSGRDLNPLTSRVWVCVRMCTRLRCRSTIQFGSFEAGAVAKPPASTSKTWATPSSVDFLQSEKPDEPLRRLSCSGPQFLCSDS